MQSERCRSRGADDGKACLQFFRELLLHVIGEENPVLFGNLAELIVRAVIDRNGIYDDPVVLAPVDIRLISIWHAAGLILNVRSKL